MLALAARHSTLCTDSRSMCSLLCVSQAVQQAVLDKCGAPGINGLSVSLIAAAPGTKAAQDVTAQLAWLRKFSPLVQTFSYRCCEPQYNHDKLQFERSAVRQQELVVLQAILQLRPQRLELQAHFPARFLPASCREHLTQLRIKDFKPGDTDDLQDALQQLSKLQELKLEDTNLGYSQALVLTKLTALTLLDVSRGRV